MTPILEVRHKINGKCFQGGPERANAATSFTNIKSIYVTSSAACLVQAEIATPCLANDSPNRDRRKIQ